MKRKPLLLLAPLIFAGAGLAVLGAKNPGNSAITLETHPDLRLRTRRYNCSINEAQQVVLSVIANLRTYGKAWRVVSEKENEIRVQVPVLMFTDDLVVELEPAPDGVILNARSSARMGKSDFGENRRHLLQLLSALDDKLPAN